MSRTDTVLCAACLGSHQTRVGSPRRGETRLISWRADPVRRKPRRATHVSAFMLPSLPGARSVSVSVLMGPGHPCLLRRISRQNAAARQGRRIGCHMNLPLCNHSSRGRQRGVRVLFVETRPTRS